MEYLTMKTVLMTSATALLLGLAIAPAMAADTASCQASWTKMDAKKAGFVMAADAKNETAAMTKAGRKMAAADRITDKEYMDACVAGVFNTSPK